MIRNFLAPDIYWTPIEDKVIILDGRRDTYVALTGDLADHWRGWAGGSSPEIPESSVTAFERRGWLVSDARPDPPTLPRSRRAGHAGIPQALRAIAEVRLRLRFAGFKAAHDYARRIAPGEAPRSDLAPASRSFARAQDLVPSSRGLADCLPSSLSLHVHLRRAGFAVRHCIGVKLYPFEAHAWVENPAGEVILDVPSRIARFQRIAELI